MYACLIQLIRGISLSSMFGKLFDLADLVVLDRFHDQLCLSDLQFEFRSNRSTDQCTMILKETIAYYVNNGSLSSVQCFSQCNQSASSGGIL